MRRRMASEMRKRKQKVEFIYLLAEKSFLLVCSIVSGRREEKKLFLLARNRNKQTEEDEAKRRLMDAHNLHGFCPSHIKFSFLFVLAINSEAPFAPFSLLFKKKIGKSMKNSSRKLIHHIEATRRRIAVRVLRSFAAASSYVFILSISSARVHGSHLHGPAQVHG
jgi:hypothetical protein